MKTQSSQQGTPKGYKSGKDFEQRSPIKMENFLSLYEKYLNCQGHKRPTEEPQFKDFRNQLQQSTSLHYLSKKSDLGLHRFSLDNFNSDKSQKGLKSYLTTINSSNSVLQKGNNSYFPVGKNDTSQGRSQTADGQSILTDDVDRKSMKNEKFLIEMMSKTKRLAEKLQHINPVKNTTPTLACKVRGSPTLAHLLKRPSLIKSKESQQQHQLKGIISKTKLLLEQYARENKFLIQTNENLQTSLIELRSEMIRKDNEIQGLKNLL